MSRSDHLLVHGGCVLVGVHGVLVLGASGSGKSFTARRIVTSCASMGRYAAMIADDQVCITRFDAPDPTLPPCLVARPPANLAGLQEVRGLGVIPSFYEPAALIRCVIELCAVQPKAGLPRIPDMDDSNLTLLGVKLPRLKVRDADMAVDLLNSVLDLRNGQDSPTRELHVINEWFPLAFGPQHGNDKDS
jgi:HPr kinase/phosphorylase